MLKFEIPTKTIEDAYLFNQKKIDLNYGHTHRYNGRVTFFPLIYAIILFLSILVSSVMFGYVSKHKKNHSFLHEATTQGSAMEVLKCNL
ncbi:hypothetical protein GQ473_00230 [archaeon]|nr:hypothetical protein [archaeon]